MVEIVRIYLVIHRHIRKERLCGITAVARIKEFNYQRISMHDDIQCAVTIQVHNSERTIQFFFLPSSIFASIVDDTRLFINKIFDTIGVQIHSTHRSGNLLIDTLRTS